MYNTYFGFREKPFNVTPDPRFFYTNPGYQEAYANLYYGIGQRKGFLVLTGEVGTGKTTILRRLMENLDSSARFVFFYNTTLTFEELLTFICDELSLEVRGNGRLERIQALNQFLLDQMRKGSTGVLCIDEAQNLSEPVFEDLRLLSNLETSTEKLLQIVLAGQPELEKKLAQPGLRQLKQRIALQWRLEPLSEKEVEAFIDFRLRAVDYQGRTLFSREAIKQIALYSKGIPRLINIICDNALLIAFGASQRKISGTMIDEVANDLRLAPDRQTPSHSFWFSARKKPQDAVQSTAMPPNLPAIENDQPMEAASENDRADEVLSTPFLDDMTRALTEAMGPMAPLVLEDHLIALDGSSAGFPRRKAQELVESVSSEILDDLLKAGFRERMSQMISSLNGNGSSLVREAK